MAFVSSSRSLAERLSYSGDDVWPHDRYAADDAFQPRPRKPRNLEPEIDPDYQYTPWVDSMKVNGDETKEQRLHDEIVAYMSYVQPTTQEQTTRGKMYDFVRETVKRRFNRSEVGLFGSVAHDLCLPDGDLDIVVRLPNIDHRADIKKILFKLSATLKGSGITSDIQVNHFARVPVVKFQTLPDFGSLNFDLSINTDGYKAVEIISSYLMKMPALRPLVLVLKSFLKLRNLNSAASSGLSSYALTCMTISFIQLNPGKKPSEYINKPMESKSLGILLIDFLHYYGTTFPYDDYYVSVTRGKLLPKESADWINYNGGHDKLCIQCLVDAENDIGKSAGKIEQIRTAFREAHTALINFPYTSSSTNILGTTNIARITQKTIDQRAHIANIVDSGKLLIRGPRVGEYQPSRSHNKGSYQPRRDDAYHSGFGSCYHDPSGTSSSHGDRHSPAIKRRRY